MVERCYFQNRIFRNEKTDEEKKNSYVIAKKPVLKIA